MTKACYKKTKQCIHGIDREEICFVCERSSSYLKRAIEKLDKICAKKGSASFEVTFTLAEEFKLWLVANQIKRPVKEASIDWYLSDLKERGKLSEKKKCDFKLGYSVAKFFPDLKNPHRRKLPFGAYRVIANANIAEEKKNKLRKIAEKHKLGIPYIYKLLARRYKIGRIRRIPETITFTSREEFFNRINEFLDEHKDITMGVKISLVAKVDIRNIHKNLA